MLDAADACLDTPRGVTVNAGGCANFELAAGAANLLRAGDQSFTDAVGAINAQRRIAAFAPRLRRAFRIYARALAALDRGDPCGAAQRYTAFIGRVGTVEQAMARRITALGAQMAPLPCDDSDAADFTPAEFELAHLQTAHALLRAAQRRLAAPGRLLDTACAGVHGPLSARGRIVALDDAAQRVLLDSGLALHQARGHQRHAISVGMTVQVSGLDMGQGTGIALGIEPDQVIAKPAALPVGCVFFRILPVQAFPPYANGPLVTHDPLGYTIPWASETRLVVEIGQRFAVLNGGCSGPPTGGSFERYSANLKLKYRAASGTKTITLASDLEEGDTPVGFPSDIVPDTDATMTVALRRQTCSTLPSNIIACSPVEALGSTTYVFMVQALGTLCSAHYADAEFDVDDYPGTVRGTHVTSAAPTITIGDSPLGGDPTDLAFQAEGYGFDGANSTYPVVQPVYVGTPFAIGPLSQDFFDEADVHAAEKTGVRFAAGLRFPALHGKRGGHSFWYMCTSQRVTRDVLAYCGGGDPNTYYRLPFEGGAPTWKMGPGNFEVFTHQGAGAYSYDFGAAAGTQVLAARAGRVLEVDVQNSGNCYDKAAQQCNNCTPPNGTNHVFVMHHDGTIGHYLHAPQNGAEVVEEQEVVRGTPLAIVGSTGCAGGPHVHFSSVKGPDQPTTPIRFESAVSGHETCYNPKKGDPIESTNTAVP